MLRIHAKCEISGVPRYNLHVYLVSLLYSWRLRNCHAQILSHALARLRARNAVADLEGAEPAPPLPSLGDRLRPSLTAMLANATFFDRSTVKHGTQNIQNDCHQWLSGSFRVHTIRFRPGLCPDPTGGAYSAPRGPLAGLRGPNSKGEKKWRKREKEGKRKGTGGTAPLRKFLDPPLRNEPRFEGHLRSPGECRVHS